MTICSLDEPAALPPRDNTETSARLPWIDLGALPAFPEGRG